MSGRDLARRTLGGWLPAHLAAGASLLAAIALASALLAPQAALAAGFGSFGPTGQMGSARYGAAAAPLPDGRVLVAGGASGGGELSSAEVFNPQTNTFSPVANPMAQAREFPAAVSLPDGRVLIAGGFTGATETANAEVFLPASNSFSNAGIGGMSSAREGPAAAPLPDGRVLVAGGASGFFAFLSSAEVFNPQTNSFSSAGLGAMSSARFAAAAAALPDGRVLVAGGQENGSSILSSAEVFNPQTNSFSAVGPMGSARFGPAAAPLPDGRVLVAGGTSGAGFLSSAEVFNPQTNSFSSAGIGAMGSARFGPAAAPLPDGRVLVTGGLIGTTALSSAEVFAATNAFAVTVRGKSLIVSVQASGAVSVSDAASPLGASAAKKKKRKPLLKQSSGAGDPPTITVSLRLSKLAKQKLRRKGKVTVNARITFAPQGGLASTRTKKLKIRGKKQRGKK